MFCKCFRNSSIGERWRKYYVVKGGGGGSLPIHSKDYGINSIVMESFP